MQRTGLQRGRAAFSLQPAGGQRCRRQTFPSNFQAPGDAATHSGRGPVSVQVDRRRTPAGPNTTHPAHLTLRRDPVPSFPPPTAAAHHCSFAAVSQFRFGGPASHYHDDFYPCQFSPARLAPNCTTALPPLLATSTSPCLIRRRHATPHAVRRVGPELRIGRVRSGGPLGHDGACWHRCSMPSESPSARNQEQSRSGPTGAPQDAANFPEKNL